jgi:translation elongation factor EF-G
MPTFTDTAGRTWTVELNIAAVKRVRSLTGTDLLEVLSGKLIDRLIADPVLLVDVLFAILKPEADANGVSDEDFGRAMAGDAIEQATQALLQAIVSFCPSPKDRAALGRVLEATNLALDRARDAVAARLEGTLAGGELDRVVEAALREVTPGNSSNSAPASSGSTPDRSH